MSPELGRRSSDANRRQHALTPPLQQMPLFLAQIAVVVIVLNIGMGTSIPGRSGAFSLTYRSSARSDEELRKSE